MKKKKMIKNNEGSITVTCAPGRQLPKKGIKIKVTRRIIEQVKKLHRNQCGPTCQHNLAAEAMAVALKAKGFPEVVVDTGKLPSGPPLNCPHVE